MSSIAYVDHSFHKKTCSTAFLPDLLRRHGHSVNHFWDESWTGGSPVDWKFVEHHDVVIMFQAYCPILKANYRKLHSNVIFIPMLDQFGIWQGPLFNLTKFWEPFQGSKVISFSDAVHAIAVGNGIFSYKSRYYQEVVGVNRPRKDGLHGFFWLRREDQISWKTIKSLISKTNFSSLHIHIAGDPGSPTPKPPSQEDIRHFNITISNWFESKSDFYRVLDSANVYFCPRMEEGIGQSFLEALARGQCVVAPNHGTMNEYIIDGINGLLYDVSNPTALCFDRFNQIGVNAIESVSRGRQLWEENEGNLVRFIVTPSDMLYFGKYKHRPRIGNVKSFVKRYLVAIASKNNGLKFFGKIYNYLKSFNKK